MFASGTGSMRGPRVKTPLLLLLLLLTGTVFCQDDANADEEADADADAELEPEPESEPEPDEEPGDPEPGDDGEQEISDNSETTITPELFSQLYDVETTFEEDQEGSVPIDETTFDSNITTSTDVAPDEFQNPLIILIPVVLVVLIIAIIVCFIFINRRCKQNQKDQELRKEDPYLDGSSTEKVPMPMFEEDVPSVLELEMEEFDNWMKKDGDPAEDSKHV
ncbi:transmembrane protein 154 isoform X2 [Eleginops maclovinus]|uniref:transmembrane protein 154 isoform X2 n=1 Tax=Eleginops maclovinus TaxID=56733 RepID=UPI00308040E7